MIQERHIFSLLPRQQEDAHQFATLTLDPEELKLSIQKNFGIGWDPTAVGDSFARQVVFIGIYDGYAYLGLV